MGNPSIDSKIGEIVEKFNFLNELNDDERIEAINSIRAELSKYSPYSDNPVDCVLWVTSNQVAGNSYNPNVVATPEMELLKLSIESDGYTQPIVVWRTADAAYEVVDGFHRHLVGKSLTKKLHGRLPVAIIRDDRQDQKDRMAATIRHNRARGVHKVDGMSEIVLELSRRNWSDEKIGKELGMEPDEVLRLRQISGLAELFSNEEFSEAWEPA